MVWKRHILLVFELLIGVNFQRNGIWKKSCSKCDKQLKSFLSVFDCFVDRYTFKIRDSVLVRVIHSNAKYAWCNNQPFPCFQYATTSLFHSGPRIFDFSRCHNYPPTTSTGPTQPRPHKNNEADGIATQTQHNKPKDKKSFFVRGSPHYVVYFVIKLVHPNEEPTKFCSFVHFDLKNILTRNKFFLPLSWRYYGQAPSVWNW